MKYEPILRLGSISERRQSDALTEAVETETAALSGWVSCPSLQL